MQHAHVTFDFQAHVTLGLFQFHVTLESFYLQF
jgi:hypothetical protein